jgi:hypothetical protein
VITASRAKTFSWRNFQFVGTEEDRNNEESPMTPIKRFLIIAICIAFIIYGVIRVNDDGNWNPFHSGTRSLQMIVPSGFLYVASP